MVTENSVDKTRESEENRLTIKSNFIGILKILVLRK